MLQTDSVIAAPVLTHQVNARTMGASHRHVASEPDCCVETPAQGDTPAVVGQHDDGGGRGDGDASQVGNVQGASLPEHEAGAEPLLLRQRPPARRC